MKNTLFYLSLSFLVFACSHNRNPASVSEGGVIVESKAGGNILAHLSTESKKQSTCLNIELTLIGAKKEQATPKNWSLAWVDKKEHYHLIALKSRDPASLPSGGEKVAPYGHFEKWTQHFVSCLPTEQFKKINAVILTAKSTPYGIKELKFNLLEQ